MLINISCSSQENKNRDKFSINDTIDYSKLVKFDRSIFQLIKKDEKPQDEIILKNKNNCFISFPSIVLCSDAIVFNFHGTIVDNNGSPINSVKIELINARSGTTYAAYSDSSGYYSIDAVIDKPYIFRVSNHAYHDFIMNNFEPICDEV